MEENHRPRRKGIHYGFSDSDTFADLTTAKRLLKKFRKKKKQLLKSNKAY